MPEAMLAGGLTDAVAVPTCDGKAFGKPESLPTPHRLELPYILVKPQTPKPEMKSHELPVSQGIPCPAVTSTGSAQPTGLGGSSLRVFVLGRVRVRV